MNKKTIYLFSAVMLLLAIYLASYGVFFERYISFLETLFSGSITGTPMNDFQNIAYIWIVKIFYWLYTTWPKVYWFDGIHILVSIVAFGIYVSSIINLCTQRGMSTGLVLSLVLPAATLCYYDFVSCNNCREILILLPIILLQYGGWGTKVRPGKIKYTALSFSFLLVILLRYEFAVIAIAGFIGFMIFDRQQTKAVWRYFIAPIFLFAMIGGYLYYDRNYSGDYAKETDFSQYLISDAKNVFALDEFKTPQDSMRYVAATELWLSDTANLKVDFFRSLQKYKVNLSIIYFQDYFPTYFSQANEMFFYFVSENKYFVIYVLFVALYLLSESYFIRKNIRSQWPKIVGPLFICSLIVFLLCYLVKMETTVFQPMCLASVLYMLASEGPSTIAYKKSVGLSNAFSVVFIILFIYANLALHDFYISRKKTYEQNRTICLEVARQSQGKYLMIDQSSNNIFDHRPFQNFVFKDTKNILLYDDGQLILSDPFLKYHQDICQCNALDNKSFYSFVYKNKEQLVFLSCEQRMNFAFSYLRIMHHLPYWYDLVQGDFKVDKIRQEGPQLHYYKMIDKSF